MGICENCHIKDECFVDMDCWNGCNRFDEIECKQQQIIDTMYDIIGENLSETAKNEYEIFIYSENFFIKGM